MRLVLCDSNRILGEALAPALTARGHQVAAITTTVAAGIAAVLEHRPDACLLGMRFPSDEDGLNAAAAIRARCPRTAVVILSGSPTQAAVSQARTLGVAGFLAKDQNIDQIGQALDVVAAGKTAFQPTLLCRGPEGRSNAAGLPHGLTPRETEVLRRIVEGQGTKQMTREMNISAGTLRSYVKSLLLKLGAHSRLQAAALASREGLLPDLDRAPADRWASATNGRPRHPPVPQLS